MRKYKLTVDSQDSLPWYIELFQRRRRRWIIVNGDWQDDTILAASKNRKDLEAYLSELDNWYDEFERPYPWYIEETFVHRPISSKVVRWWFFSNINDRRRKRIDQKWMRNWEKQDEALARSTDKIVSELKQQAGYEHIVNYHPNIDRIDEDLWEEKGDDHERQIDSD